MSGTAPARTTRRPARAALRAACALGLLVCWAFGAGPTFAQARGLGDPFFPAVGNPGYDAVHYDVGLSYSPQTGVLRAVATIEAVAAQPLPSFSLDLRGLRVSAVTLDGSPARFTHRGGKLRVTPGSPIAAGAAFVAVVRYRGAPHRIVDPDRSSEGWIRTGDGAVTLSEPVGTASWLPCNDTPADKATFRFEVAVPAELKGIANGRLVSVRERGGRRTFVWEEAEPMAPYLALVAIGRGRLIRSEIAGLPAWTLVDPRFDRSARRILGLLPEIVRFESRAFGPYPFDALGSVLDPAPVGYALETQTRPIYPYLPSRTEVAHEMAHQWFGDSVGLTRWPEIWLNEGLATWAEWYFAERHGGRSVSQVFADLYSTPASAEDFWDPPSGRPGDPKHLFASSVYLRGGMALQALRARIGTETLLAILRRWTTEHRHANATIDQFISLAEEVSGGPLQTFFDDWLYSSGKPRGYG